MDLPEAIEMDLVGYGAVLQFIDAKGTSFMRENTARDI